MVANVEFQDDFGANFNTSRNIQVLSAPTAEGLEEILQSIKRPMHIQAMYASGSKHYAWIIMDVKLKIKRK